MKKQKSQFYPFVKYLFDEDYWTNFCIKTKKMKQLSILLLTTVFVLFSCKKVTTKKIDKTITDGQWRVELFSEDGFNETNYFSGYVFDFNENNTVSAVNGSITVIGTWSTSKSFSDDDSKHSHLNLSFSSTHNFDELTDDWHVISLSDSKIELKDVSGGDGSVDLLTYVKV